MLVKAEMSLGLSVSMVNESVGGFQGFSSEPSPSVLGCVGFAFTALTEGWLPMHAGGLGRQQMLGGTESLQVFCYNTNGAILGLCLLADKLRACFSVISVFF